MYIKKEIVSALQKVACSYYSVCISISSHNDIRIYNLVDVWNSLYFTALYPFRGVDPAEAEMNYLNTAKMLDLYGVDIHTVMVRNTILIFKLNKPRRAIKARAAKNQFMVYHW